MPKLRHLIAAFCFVVGLAMAGAEGCHWLNNVAGLLIFTGFPIIMIREGKEHDITID
jgi:hypothetical protein